MAQTIMSANDESNPQSRPDDCTADWYIHGAFSGQNPPNLNQTTMSCPWQSFQMPPVNPTTPMMAGVVQPQSYTYQTPTNEPPHQFNLPEKGSITSYTGPPRYSSSQTLLNSDPQQPAVAFSPQQTNMHHAFQPANHYAGTQNFISNVNHRPPKTISHPLEFDSYSQPLGYCASATTFAPSGGLPYPSYTVTEQPIDTPVMPFNGSGFGGQIYPDYSESSSYNNTKRSVNHANSKTLAQSGNSSSPSIDVLPQSLPESTSVANLPQPNVKYPTKPETKETQFYKIWENSNPKTYYHQHGLFMKQHPRHIFAYFGCILDVEQDSGYQTGETGAVPGRDPPEKYADALTILERDLMIYPSCCGVTFDTRMSWQKHQLMHLIETYEVVQPVKLKSNPKHKRSNNKTKGKGGRTWNCSQSPQCESTSHGKPKWEKHEWLHFPQKLWLCVICFQDRNSRHAVSIRKDRFRSHFKKHHKLNVTEEQCETCCIAIESKFARNCHYSGCEATFDGWEDRGNHFIKTHQVASQTDKNDVDEVMDVDEDHESRLQSDDQESSGSDACKESSDEDSDHDEGGSGGGNCGFSSGPGTSNGSSNKEPRDRRSRNNNQSSDRNNHQAASKAYSNMNWKRRFLTESASISHILNGRELDQSYRICGEAPHTQEFEYDCAKILANDSLNSISQRQPSYRFLGSGSTAVVDEIQERGAMTARKVVRYRYPDERKRVDREVSIMRRLRHSHVAHLVRNWSDTTTATLLIQPAADYSLSYYIRTRSSTTPTETDTWKWFNCLVSGLQYIHTGGVIHGDIKPGNILVSNHRIIYTDFGISNAIQDNTTTISDSGFMTKQYAAPEVRRGERGMPSDIWSLGCVFLELLTVMLKRSVKDFYNIRNQKRDRGSKDLSYSANMALIANWITVLTNVSNIKSAPPIALIALNSCEIMMRAEPEKRPTILELTQRIRPQSCCIPYEYVPPTSKIQLAGKFWSSSVLSWLQEYSSLEASFSGFIDIGRARGGSLEPARLTFIRNFIEGLSKMDMCPRTDVKSMTNGGLLQNCSPTAYPAALTPSKNAIIRSIIPEQSMPLSDDGLSYPRFFSALPILLSPRMQDPADFAANRSTQATNNWELITDGDYNSQPGKLSSAKERSNYSAFTVRSGARVWPDGLEMGMKRWLNDASGHTVVFIHGLGGKGKTQLAIAFLRRQKINYSGIFWSEGQDEDTLKLSFAVMVKNFSRERDSMALIGGLRNSQLARMFTKKVKYPSWEEANADFIRVHFDWLSDKGNGKWMMVFDHADRFVPVSSESKPPKFLSGFLPDSPNGSISTTSRSHDIALKPRRNDEDILDVKIMIAALCQRRLRNIIETIDMMEQPQGQQSFTGALLVPSERYFISFMSCALLIWVYSHVSQVPPVPSALVPFWNCCLLLSLIGIFFISFLQSITIAKYPVIVHWTYPLFYVLKHLGHHTTNGIGKHIFQASIMLLSYAIISQTVFSTALDLVPLFRDYGGFTHISAATLSMHVSFCLWILTIAHFMMPMLDRNYRLPLDLNNKDISVAEKGFEKSDILKSLHTLNSMSKDAVGNRRREYSCGDGLDMTS